MSDKALLDRRLLSLIRDSYHASSGVYGYRRVLGDLRETGEFCSKHRVANIMRANHLQRQVTVAQPDQAWITDITYLRTWQGWLYLAVVIDLHSRKVVSWSMKPTLAHELAIDAAIAGIMPWLNLFLAVEERTHP